MKIKILFSIAFYFIFSCVCKSQNDTTYHGDNVSIPIMKSLILGKWVNADDTTWSLYITKDSMIERTYFKKTNTYLLDRYIYSIGFHTAGSAAPAGAPNLLNWQGYYIQAWDNSDPNNENFTTRAIYSLNYKYLKLEVNGESVFKRVNKISNYPPK